MTDGSSARNRPIPADIAAEVRRLYEAGETSATEIARRLGVHRNSVARLAERGGWRRRAAARAALVAKIRARVESEIDQVERVMGSGTPGSHGVPDAAERSARTLASLVRTLRELASFDADRERAAARANREADRGGDKDGALEDLDALREALADRLEQLRREHET